MKIHVELPDEQMELISKMVEGGSNTEKVRNFITSQLITKKALENAIEFKKAELKHLHNALKTNIFEDLVNLPKEERDYLQETIGLIDTKGEKYVYGRCKAYNNMFNNKLSVKEFRLLIYEMKNGNR